MIITVVLPAYCLLGYNNAVIGGLLSLESFVEQFPSIDTVHTTGSTKSENARVQGIASQRLIRKLVGRILMFDQALW